METIYLWPDQPALSILVLWLISTIVLWAARTPVLQLLGELGTNVEEGLKGLAQRCGNAADCGVRCANGGTCSGATGRDEHAEPADAVIAVKNWAVKTPHVELKWAIIDGFLG